MDRVVAEHQQFSHSVKDLQDWMADAVHMLDSYCHPTADKSVLDSRMLKLEVWKKQTPKPALFRSVRRLQIWDNLYQLLRISVMTAVVQTLIFNLLKNNSFYRGKSSLLEVFPKKDIGTFMI